LGIATAALVLSGTDPRDPVERTHAAARVLTLLAVVFLTNSITRSLRQKHRRLARQNRRIRRMSRDLQRQQRTMIQHEKMVALGQMAAGVTHEIANPLASMDGLLQLLQRKPEKMGAESVATLREQVARINQIILQMKDFAHPHEKEWRTMSLNDLVQLAVRMLQFDRRLKGVRLDVQLSPDVGAVTVIPQALEQILVNLMINALDAMAESREPRLAVRTASQAASYIVEVSDTGHGIRPEHMRRLFEPFFTTKAVGKGTGLGLSISYSLVRKLGGEISVRSAPGGGSTFTIRLPATRGDSRESPPADAPVAISGNQAM
jgi:two-component system C4-dicarboxylate transport sensor histidine kinase DctB